MRSGTISGFTASGITTIVFIMALALLLQGCGRKAALTLPSSKGRVSQNKATTGNAPQPQATQLPVSAPQAVNVQNPAKPPSQQNNEP